MREETLSTLQIPAFSIGVMVDVLERAGIDPSPAFRRIGLDARGHLPSSGFVSAKAEIAFERAFRDLTPMRRDLWVEVGRRHRAASYGLFGLAVHTSPTLRDFVKISGKTRDLCLSFVDYRPVERQGKLCGFEFCLDGVPEDLQEMTLYRDVGAMSAAFEDLWRGSTRAFRLELNPSAEAAQVIRKLIQFKVRFARPRTALIWPAALTDAPLPNGNEYLHRYYLEQCEAVLKQVSANDLAARITRVIMLQPAMHSTAGAVARRLNISVRTLQRRLSEDGTTFRSVLTRAQIEIAKNHLQKSSMSIAQIASQLGYADRPSFDLAFCRWTGTSPRKFRDQVMSQASA